jgi:hypothetical protein
MQQAIGQPGHAVAASVDEGRVTGQQRPNPATARRDHHQVAVEIVGDHA